MLSMKQSQYNQKASLLERLLHEGKVVEAETVRKEMGTLAQDYHDTGKLDYAGTHWTKPTYALRYKNGGKLIPRI
jgi:hypothetical protein